MKATMKSIFSTSVTDTEYFYDNQNKIELLSCPGKKMICQEHLATVNKCYIQSEQAVRDKDFQKAIGNLKDAFYKTTELVNLPCSKCASLFRSTITESLENMHSELEKMTSGIFGKKSYHPSRIKAIEVLNEFEKLKLNETFKINESKKRYIGNYLKQKVS